MADDFEFDDNDDEEIEADIDDEDEDDSDDDDSELEDDEDEDEEEDEDEDLDDDGEDSDIEAVLSDGTEIPLIVEGDKVEVDFETLSETEPSEISASNWEELLGNDYSFEDLAAQYDEDSIYEIEIGIDYAEAA